MSSKFLLIGLGGRTALLAVFALACVHSTFSAKAAIVANWTFDTGGAQNGTRLGAGSSGALNYEANTFATADLSAATISTVTPAGTAGITATTQNRGGGNAPSATTAMQFATGLNFGNGGQNVNGSSFTLSFTTGANIGLTTISLTYDVFAENSAASAVNTWHLTGGTGGTATQTSTLAYTGGNWRTVTVTWTGLTVAKNTTFTIQDTLSGFANAAATIGDTSDVRFDNLNLNASVVPEPVNCALAGFGLIFASVGAGRFYLRRKNISPAA